MKLTKQRLKQIIREELDQEAPTQPHSPERYAAVLRRLRKPRQPDEAMAKAMATMKELMATMREMGEGAAADDLEVALDALASKQGIDLDDPSESEEFSGTAYEDAWKR